MSRARTDDGPRAGLGSVNVGFIGLGLMGSPIAANLARAGADLWVWNRTREKAEAFARDVPCTIADDPVALAQRSDVVITMVADGDALEDIYFRDGFTAALGDGAIAIDMSTIGPIAARAIGERLARSGIRFVDAPVSGSTDAATAATLTIFVGAEAEDFAAVEGLLEVLGKEVVHVGGPGQAALVKLAVNNLIYGINECLSEALVLAERAGLEREVAYNAFLNSAAAAPVMGYRREAFVHPDGAPVSFSVRLGEKDMRLTVELAELVGAPMPQAQTNLAVARAAAEAGFAEHDVSAIAQYLRSQAAGAALTDGARAPRPAQAG
jgi:3-hydroxyisobutyrate dehydrogenase-like beta-hydroxyacid dehydrogenase